MRYITRTLVAALFCMALAVNCRVFQIFRRGVEMRIVDPNADVPARAPVQSIVKAIARSRDWYERVIGGEFCTIEQMATYSGLTKRYVRKILQCAYLSPTVTQDILEGKHPSQLTLKQIVRGVPTTWRDQERGILNR
jgi:site-specific DNA recombinase